MAGPEHPVEALLALQHPARAARRHPGEPPPCSLAESARRALRPPSTARARTRPRVPGTRPILRSNTRAPSQRAPVGAFASIALLDVRQTSGSRPGFRPLTSRVQEPAAFFDVA